MLAVPEAEHLDVGDTDGAAGRRDLAHRAVEDAVVRAGECTLLNGDVVDHVKAAHIDMRVRKGVEPARKKLNAGGFSLTMHPTGRFESDIIGKHVRETVDVVGIKSFRSSLKRFACAHIHLNILPD